MSLDSIKKEFWGDLQMDLAVKNSAIYLANQRLESLISTDGRKAHRPILSNPDMGNYVAHTDIDFDTKSSTDQYLEVDTYPYAAEDIDITESSQTSYDLVQHSLKSIRSGLMNKIEQKFLSEIANASHTIAGGAINLGGSNILDVLEDAEGMLGAFDAPYETEMRAAVFGPKTVARLRRAKGERETKLGDSVLENGIVGPWNGWTVVQNNNLPWSANLFLDTQPIEGDTIVISGVTFTAKATPVNPGDVDIAAAATFRANLKAAVEGGAGAGTAYIELSNRDKFLLRRKRAVTCTSAETMAFAGFGDISVSETLTATTNVWSDQEQSSIFMIRGSIDMVIQLMDLETTAKEKGFAKLTKGIVGVGTKVFSDGADMMVKLTQDASSF